MHRWIIGGLTAIVLILLLTLGSLGGTLLATFLLILFVTAFADVSFIVEFLVALIGLGIAVDYSLLVVYRFREELAAGKAVEDAVVRTMETAGRTVIERGSDRPLTRAQRFQASTLKRTNADTRRRIRHCFDGA